MLCLWLPFTDGVIKNQGLINDEFITSIDPTFSNDGKLGKCLEQGQFDMSATMTSKILNNQALTICFWIYINAEEGSQGGTIFGNINTNVEFNNRKFSIFQYPTCNDLHLSWMNDAAKAFIMTPIYKGVLPSYQWTHVTVTYHNPIMTVYINGIKKYTYSSVSNSSSFEYQTRVVWQNAYRKLNDFRIYNECLSPRQVKEISKGLVCHYPLGEIDGKIGGRNLIKNGKGNVKSGFFKNMNTDSGEYGEFTLKSKRNYTTVSLSGGFVYGCHDYAVGEKYTWSYDIMYTDWNFPTGTNRQEFWMGQRYTNAPSGENATGTWKPVTAHNLPVVGQNGCELNKWYHNEVTKTIPEQASSNVNTVATIQFYNPNADVEASFTARIKNVKLEKSSTATPWTPAPEDYASFYDNVIYDTSGYCNNGSVTDSTCPTWSSDTPRYKGSYVFNGNKQYVNCGVSTMIEGQEEITINCWAYMDDWTKFNARLFSCTENGGYNTEGVSSSIKFALNIYTTSDKSKYAYNSTTGGYPGIKLSDMSSGWHMITCVYKASVGDSMYLDGKLYEKKTYTSYGIHFNKNSYLFLGGESAGVNCIAPYFNGKLSDFRIYVTALDNQTIEELYKVGALVDNNGNLMLAGEVIEE